MDLIRYPIRTVARLTGISLDTLRAWERRYGAVKPERGRRGRLYSEQDIQRLTLLHEAVERGHSIGQIAGMKDTQLRELVSRSNGTAAFVSPRAGSSANGTDLWHPALQAIERFDYAEASHQLGRLAALLSPEDFVNEVVVPLMRAVGEGWHNGSYSVAQEHMLSSIVRNVLGSLVRVQPTSGRGPSILIATPAGELHEFGILAAAILASGRGVGIIYLGPNLPAAEIILASKRSAVKAVLLGMAGDKPISSIVKEIRLLAKRLPAAVELWVGGRNLPSVSRSAPDGRIVAIEDFDGLYRHLARLEGSARNTEV